MAGRRFGFPLLTAAVCCCLVNGCSELDDGRVLVRGSVAYKGQPVPYGSISLRPAAGARGFAAGGEIRDGVFEIPRKNGPSVGQYSARFTIVLADEKESSRMGGQMKTFEVPVEVIAGEDEYQFELPISRNP